MIWHERPGPPDSRIVLEQSINALPEAWLQPPQSGEVFDSLEQCIKRIRAYALAEGFDIPKTGGFRKGWVNTMSAGFMA